MPRAIVVALALLVAPCAAWAAEQAARQSAFLDALTWGVTASSLVDLQAKGRARWLDEQLRPAGEGPVPPEVRQRIAALTPTEPLRDRMAAYDAQRREAKTLADPVEKRAGFKAYRTEIKTNAQDAAAVFLLRALHEPAQVRERMVWFWFNRFNVYAGKADLRAMVGDYVDRALRPHALGRFRDLVEATLRHPAMLRYLDNANSAVGRMNENYARELLELHTMGVGSGYTQEDVTALARILTGVGIRVRPEDPRLPPDKRADLLRDGLFVFDPSRHDYGDKTFLGRTIRGRGWAEVTEALDLICRHPATARHVSRSLAAYFMGADPPEALVQRLSAAFRQSDGDIAAVMRALATAPEFEASLDRGVKDPMRFVLSAVRLSYDDRPVVDPAPVRSWLGRLGMGLFDRSTPDGYPLDAAAWTGSGQMTARFEVARQIASGRAGLFGPAEGEDPGERAPPLLQKNAEAAHLSETLSGATRGALAKAASQREWNTLFLSSPEFMR